MVAFVWRLSGLREIAQRMGRMLGTSKFGSLSPALARPWSLAYVQRLVQHIESKHEPKRDDLIALDSMAITLKATQRHRCQKMNSKTVGGGVIWAFMIGAGRGCCPVKILKVMAGAWNDSYQMRGIELVTNGPVYLMDRGFFALGLMQGWIDQGVRFIVRSRKLVGIEELHTISSPRAYGRGHIEMDAWVRLGASQAKAHPEVRFIRARIGKTLLEVVTSEQTWSAEQILDAYKKRDRIEQFHRFIKETVGLAHLYSFSHDGMMFLLHTAILLALLLLLSGNKLASDTMTTLRNLLKALRSSLGLTFFWRRNTLAATRSKGNHRENP